MSFLYANLPGQALTLPAPLATLGFQARLINGIEVIMPPLCEVPVGPFIMGAEAKPPFYRHSEAPEHIVTLDAFMIATYPLTVAEYACMIRAGAAKKAEVFEWERQATHLDYPVTDISWHNAVKYALWLADATRLPWRLPTEAEWEKAARGDDGRRFPWGDQWDATKMNCRRQAQPIGTYPQGASPYGMLDAMGNVKEWVSSAFNGYPYNAHDGREDLGADIRLRVLRGVLWYGFPPDAPEERPYITERHCTNTTCLWEMGTEGTRLALSL